MSAADEKNGQEELPLPEEIGFGDAVRELEKILRRIEGEEIDLDRLAAELKRATALLEVCRGKVRRAEIEVSQIVDAIGGADADADADAEPAPGEAD